MIYTINGRPQGYVTPKHASYSYEEYKQSLVKSQISLEEQNRGNQIHIRGPIQLTIRFFFKNKQRLIGHNPGRPDIFPLIKFVLTVAQGILFTNDIIIAKVDAQKFYDSYERTELEIQKL